MYEKHCRVLTSTYTNIGFLPCRGIRESTSSISLKHMCMRLKMVVELCYLVHEVYTDCDL
jgi:hypothetical protein